MLNKILDKYFLNKLKTNIDNIFIDYGLKTHYTENKDYITLNIKMEGKNITGYVEMCDFKKDRILEYIFNFNKIRKYFEGILEEYKKLERK